MTSRPSVARPVHGVLAGLTVGVALLTAGCSGSAGPGSLTTTATVAGPGPTPSTAATTTAGPVVVEELAKGTDPSVVAVDVAGPSQVVFRRITIKPGAGTGEHCHDGQLLAVVEKGTLTHYAPTYPGGVHTYTAGDTILEGAHYVHQGKNEGTEDVVLLVTYVIAQGKPLAQTDLAQCSPR